jgi:hypothetical protein
VPDFDPEEQLFRRCRQEDVDEGRLSRSAIRFPDWSVNRSRFSEPGDALLPDWAGWGVAAFAVKDVPPSVASEGGPDVEFKVEHVPLEENYAHSEVRAYKLGKHSRDLGVPKTVKSRFRQILSEKSRIVIEPQV